MVWYGIVWYGIVREVLCGSVSEAIEATEADGEQCSLRSRSTFSEIILPVDEGGGELYAALADLLTSDLPSFVTPRGVNIIMLCYEPLGMPPS